MTDTDQQSDATSTNRANRDTTTKSKTKGKAGGTGNITAGLSETPEDAMPDDSDNQGSTGSTAETLKATASKLRQQAADKARTLVSEGSARAASALDEVSRMMNEAADSVDTRLGADYGHYAHGAARMVSGLSDRIRNQELDDLIDEANNFVRKSPVMAMGIAAALGFVAARLVRAGIDAEHDA